MKTLFVVALLSLACAGASAWAWPWSSEACAEPGALREDDEGGVSVCVAGDGWRRVLAHGGLGDLRSAAPRAAPDCTGQVGQWVCDTTCSERGICLSDGSWISVGGCAASEICLEGECTTSSATCTTQPTIQCLDPGTYPSLTDCTRHYICQTAGEGVLQEECAEGFVFDACTQECNTALPKGEECPWVVNDPCAEAGTIGVAPNNDRLYYVCVLGSSGIYQLWNKCSSGHFNLASRTCENPTEPGCGSCN